MKVAEFREMTPSELTEKLSQMRHTLFELRRKQAVGNLEHPEQIAVVRKDIAKAETVLRERELAK